MIDIIWLLFSVIFGLCFGSFISMLIYRLPRNEGIFIYSKCPNCNSILSKKSLIPLFSWFIQKGKCSFCDVKISMRYPIIELITAILFLFSYSKFGNSFGTVIYDLMLVVAFSMIMIDYTDMVLPDSLQLSFFVLSIIYAIYNNYDFVYSLMGIMTYFIIFYVISLLVSKIKQIKSIGWGDLKFVMIAGLLLGYTLLPFYILLSGLMGLLFALIYKKINKNENSDNVYFPFAPALILSLLFLL